MPIKLELAQEMLLAAVRPVGTEEVPLASCWRRVLAETVVAGIDFPPFDRSPLDGYAVVAADVAQASPSSPVVLRQIDMVAAGTVPGVSVAPGTAVRIMTGAQLPAGATGVVRLEDTRAALETVEVMSGADAGKNICRQGEEIKKGEEVIPQGTLINAGVMGMLAVLGKSRPLVYRRPKVGIIATGSEIVPVDAPLAPGKIRNSNSFMLGGQVLEAGAEPVMLGAAPDDVAAICAKFSEVDCDLWLTTGGASVGDYDLIGKAFANMGVRILYDRVSMKPGMPVIAGIRDQKLYIGLSGNPAAASVSCELLVRPALLKLGGRRHWQRPVVRATLAAPFLKPTAARRFVWAHCWQEGQQMMVRPLGLQGNGMLKSAMVANALAMVPENSPPLAVGTVLDVLLLADL